MLIKTLEDAEKFVTTQRNKGRDVRWDGWDIVCFKPHKSAVYSKDGVYRAGRFGFESRAVVTTQGHWNISMN